MMKIKTLKSNTCQLYKAVDKKHLEVCTDEVSQCNFEPYVIEQYKLSSPITIQDQVSVNQEFLCLIKIEKENKFIPFQALRLEGNKIKLRGDVGNYPESRFLLYAWIPTSPPDFTFTGDGLIYTSDGVMQLQEGDFITCIDGEVAKMSTSQVLKHLSTEKTEKSPSYQQLKVAPATKRPQRPSRGTIIFNNNTSRLEIYTKDGWKGIKYEDT